MFPRKLISYIIEYSNDHLYFKFVEQRSEEKICNRLNYDYNYTYSHNHNHNHNYNYNYNHNYNYNYDHNYKKVTNSNKIATVQLI